ncbi:MAG TPA: hypothetical protein VKU01_23925 [Bryobacteraceae bacterium]|nr:hypothetical protein [Bryobacteraceae bacterium]
MPATHLSAPGEGFRSRVLKQPSAAKAAAVRNGMNALIETTSTGTTCFCDPAMLQLYGVKALCDKCRSEYLTWRDEEAALGHQPPE